MTLQFALSDIWKREVSLFLAMYVLSIALLAASAGLASAYDLPDNLKQIYNSHKVSVRSIHTLIISEDLWPTVFSPENATMSWRLVSPTG